MKQFIRLYDAVLSPYHFPLMIWFPTNFCSPDKRNDKIHNDVIARAAEGDDFLGGLTGSAW